MMVTLFPWARLCPGVLRPASLLRVLSLCGLWRQLL